MHVGRKLIVVLALCSLVASLPAPALAGETPGGGTIVGGGPVDAATVPWTVALFMTEEPDPFLAQYCGGVLIDAGWVLTAKHCLRRPSDMQVGWAKTSLSSYSAADRRSIDAAFGHPTNDVALLRLTEPVPGAPTIDLWRDTAGPPHLQRYWTYGWGTRSSVAPDFPDDLHGVEVADRSGPDEPGPCLRYGFDYEISHHVCAGWGAGGRDSCFGDSGGPLVAYTPKPLLVGLTSFGTENCGDPDWPGVYERVSSSAAWIDSTMRDLSRDGYYVLQGGAELRTPSPVSWAQLDSGSYAECGVGTDGSLWCGYPTFARVGEAHDWLSIDVGVDHMCGIKLDRSLWCWGSGQLGRLGLGDESDRAEPTRVGLDNDWTIVDAGWYGTCGIRAPGSLWCWGRNDQGQLGIGNRIGSTIPVQVGTFSDWTDIATREHGCGIRSPGSLWCWGYNATGEVGDGTRTRRLRPRQIGVGTDWQSIEVQLHTSCGLRGNGALWCWDDAPSGSAGTSPALADATETWRDFDMTIGYACLRNSESELWCTNSAGALGRVGDHGDWQTFTAASNRALAVRGIGNARRHIVGLSSADAARLTEIGTWLDLDEPGAVLKLGVFVDAFIIAISPPSLPEAVELPPAATQHAISVFWAPDELAVLETVGQQRILNDPDAHRWGFQVLSFIALLNGV